MPDSEFDPRLYDQAFVWVWLPDATDPVVAGSLSKHNQQVVFNILCSNTDDHARNHAAFWDGQALELTPAYDICPQPRTGGEASQAMRDAVKRAG